MHEDQSLDSQNPHNRQSGVVMGYNPNSWEAEKGDPRAKWLAKLEGIGELPINERPCLNK